MKDNVQSDKNHHDQLTQLTQSKIFLGREFLTWLWHQAETQQNLFTIAGSGLQAPLNGTFWIDDRILLQALDHSGHEHLMRGGSPSVSAEGATSLANGKMVKELKLGVHIDSLGEFTANLSYHELSPRSLQLPPPSEDGLEASLVLAQRLYQTQCFLKALDHLFAWFMQERTNPQWESKTLHKIRDWMRLRLHESKPTLH